MRRPNTDDADEVRRALARRLHDEVQQTLTVACMELSCIPAATTQDHPVTRSLALVREAFDQVAELIEELEGDPG